MKSIYQILCISNCLCNALKWEMIIRNELTFLSYNYITRVILQAHWTSSCRATTVLSHLRKIGSKINTDYKMVNTQNILTS